MYNATGEFINDEFLYLHENRNERVDVSTIPCQ
jgi:hypothetical protein